MVAPDSVQLSHHSITQKRPRVAGSGEDLHLWGPASGKLGDGPASAPQPRRHAGRRLLPEPSIFTATEDGIDQITLTELEPRGERPKIAHDIQLKTPIPLAELSAVSLPGL